MPKVSVVIPSYNHAAYIGQAVKSVLDQSESDLELIVIDDGSTDNSLEVLSGFSDERLKIIPQENRGAHAAINRGLENTSGEYLAILNSDDIYHPLRLEKAISLLEADPNIGLLGTHIEIINAQGKKLGVKHGYLDCEPWLLKSPDRSFRAGSDLRAALLVENYWSTTSNYVFRRVAYERVGEFRPLRYVHDWDFALRIAQIGRLVLIPEPLMRYRVHPSNTIRENQAAMIFEICWVLATNLPEHINDAQFIEYFPPATRVDQLLHSIHVFDMDRVLNVMLLQGIQQNPEQALSLLSPDDPVRKTYLSYIIEALKQKEGVTTSPAENNQAAKPISVKFVSRIIQGLRKPGSLFKS